METDGYWTCGDHFIVYMDAKLLYVNCIPIKKKRKIAQMYKPNITKISHMSSECVIFAYFTLFLSNILSTTEGVNFSIHKFQGKVAVSNDHRAFQK